MTGWATPAGHHDHARAGRAVLVSATQRGAQAPPRIENAEWETPVSQWRSDRTVVGGRRATAAGRGQALRARGYNCVRVFERYVRVLELRAQGHSFRAIAERLRISPTQAWRDYWSLLVQTPDDRARRALAGDLLRARLLAEDDRLLTYAELSARFGVPVWRVGVLVREELAAVMRRL